MDALASQIVEALLPFVKPKEGKAVPYAFLGHSLGARVAMEVALRLLPHGTSPQRVFVSGSAPSHAPRPRKALAKLLEGKASAASAAAVAASGSGSAAESKSSSSEYVPMHKLSDKDFVARLGALGGTPKEILENEEFMAFLLPSLRADFEIAETFTREAPKDKERLPCPVTVLCGQDDVLVDAARDEWAKYTSLQQSASAAASQAESKSSSGAAAKEGSQAAVSVHVIAGGHFFIYERDEAFAIVAKELGALSAAEGWTL